jgi:hypothetical protein
VQSHEPSWWLAKPPLSTVICNSSTQTCIIGYTTFVIEDIKNALASNPRPIQLIPQSRSGGSAFRLSLALTQAFTILRHEFRSLYVRNILFHVVADDAVSLSREFIGSGSIATSSEPQQLSGTIVLYHGHYCLAKFTYIKPLHLLALEHRAVNISFAVRNDFGCDCQDRNIQILNETLFNNDRSAWRSTLKRDIASFEVDLTSYPIHRNGFQSKLHTAVAKSAKSDPTKNTARDFQILVGLGLCCFW